MKSERRWNKLVSFVRRRKVRKTMEKVGLNFSLENLSNRSDGAVSLFNFQFYSQHILYLIILYLFLWLLFHFFCNISNN